MAKKSKLFKRLVSLLFLVVVPFFVLFYMMDSKNFTLEIPKYYPIIEENGDTSGYHTIPEFIFHSQDGKVFNLDSLDGKVHVGYFFFTRCPGICMDMNENMKFLQEKFKDYPNIQLVGYTVDPGYDTVNVLRRFGLKHDIDIKKWKLVTGPEQEIYKLAQEGYKITAQTAPDGTIDFVHSDRFVLVDKEGIIRGTCNGTTKREVEVFAPHILHVDLSYTRNESEAIFH